MKEQREFCRWCRNEVRITKGGYSRCDKFTEMFYCKGCLVNHEKKCEWCEKYKALNKYADRND